MHIYRRRNLKIIKQFFHLKLLCFVVTVTWTRQLSIINTLLCVDAEVESGRFHKMQGLFFHPLKQPLQQVLAQEYPECPR